MQHLLAQRESDLNVSPSLPFAPGGLIRISNLFPSPLQGGVCRDHPGADEGTDGALALGVAHILVRDGKCDRAYLEANTLGFDKLEKDVLPRFTPARHRRYAAAPQVRTMSAAPANSRGVGT